MAGLLGMIGNIGQSIRQGAGGLLSPNGIQSWQQNPATTQQPTAGINTGDPQQGFGWFRPETSFALAQMGALIAGPNSQAAQYANRLTDSRNQMQELAAKAAMSGGVFSGDGFENQAARARYDYYKSIGMSELEARNQAAADVFNREGSVTYDRLGNPIVVPGRTLPVGERAPMGQQTPVGLPVPQGQSDMGGMLMPPQISPTADRSMFGAPSMQSETLPPPSYGVSPAVVQSPVGQTSILQNQLDTSKQAQGKSQDFNQEQMKSALGTSEGAYKLESMMSDLDNAINNFETGFAGELRGQAAKAAAGAERMGIINTGGAAGKTAEGFDNIKSVSKELGKQGLAAFGGSDTQMELKTAIEVELNPNDEPAITKQKLERQKAAIRILQQKPQFMQAWGDINQPKNGQTFSEAWGNYQKQAYEQADKALRAAPKVLKYNPRTGRVE